MTKSELLRLEDAKENAFQKYVNLETKYLEAREASHEAWEAWSNAFDEIEKGA